MTQGLNNIRKICCRVTFRVIYKVKYTHFPYLLCLILLKLVGFTAEKHLEKNIKIECIILI